MKARASKKQPAADAAHSASFAPLDDARAVDALSANGGAADAVLPANGHSRPEGPRTPRSERTARRPAGPSFGLMDVVWFIPRKLMWLLFPKLVDRYVIGELLAPLVFGWTMFIVLYVFAVDIFKLAQLAAGGARLDSIGEMMWLKVVLASVLCLPMAMLLSGLLAFGRLSGDSEMIAFQAGGIPNFRVVRNAFLIGLILSFAGLALNEYVLPKAGRRLHIVQDDVKRQVTGRLVEDLIDDRPFFLPDYEGGKLTRVVVAKKFKAADPPYPALMQDVTYIQYDKGQWKTIVQADRAEWIGNKEWRFVDADTQFRDTVTNGQRFNMHSADLVLKINKTPAQLSQDRRDTTEMNYRELDAYIRELKGKNVRPKVLREMEVELERKLAVPFAALVLAFIGAPLGIRRQRSTAGVGIGLSLLIIIIYYIGMGVLGALGQSGQMGAVEAAWGCNVIGLLVGLFLTWRSS